MPDMLVKLYELPELPRQRMAQLAEEGVRFRRAIAPEKSLVVSWVRRHFSEAWANETDVAFSRQPVTCLLALQQNELLGFACYEATCKNFFGPTGVHEAHRGRGLGKILLLQALHAQRELGYGYAIIGGAGPTAFYEKACAAQLIEGSQPGIYRGMLTVTP